MSNPAALYAPSTKISARIVDGQLIILRPGNDELLRFNEVASFIWSVLEQKPASIDHLVDQVVEAFEIDPRVAHGDINTFLEEMIKQTLVICD